MKKKWAVWKTIVVIIFSVIAVAGVTVGGVYLARGGFGEAKISPESISFDFTDGSFNDSKNQLEVSDDTVEKLKLVINTPTQYVTEKTVNLDFDSETKVINRTNKTISDNCITVPLTVNIGEPFAISLNKEALKRNGVEITDAEGLVLWTRGGISNLKATTVNNKSASLKVAVDVPVYDISVTLHDEDGTAVEEITEGKTFTARANFFPEVSRYQYSDSGEGAREKLAYFEAQGTSEVTFGYDNGAYFMAGNPKAENKIVGYAFRSAYAQAEFLSRFDETVSAADIYDSCLKYLSSNAGAKDRADNLNSPANIKINEANLSSFVVGNGGHTFQNMYSGRKYTLTMQSAGEDNYIDAVINSQDGELDSMLRKVAINFTYLVGGVETEVTDDILRITDAFDNPLTSVKVGEKTYYFADTIAHPKYSGWTLFTNGIYTFRLNVALLEEEAGVFRITKINGSEAKDFLSIEVQTGAEKSVSWANKNTIPMTLDYNGSNMLPDTYTFNKDDIDIPETNMYKNPIFFAYFGNTEKADGETEEDVAKRMLAKYDSARSGKYRVGTQEFELFALEGYDLTVSDIGEFEIFFATFMSGQYDKDGKYILVRTSDSRSVKVSKTLYEDSIGEASITVVNKDGIEIPLGEGERNYYLPEGTTNKIKISFTVNENSWLTFKEQIEAGKISLDVLDRANNSITRTLFRIENINDKWYSLVEDGYRVEFILLVNNSLGLEGDVLINSVVLSDETSGETWAKPVASKGINIYTPQVKEVAFNPNVYNNDSPITVTQRLTNEGGGIEIVYIDQNGDDAIATDIQSFIRNAIAIVTVTDQHDRTDTISSWQFKTDNSNAISVSGQTFSFPADGTATLWVVCRGVPSTRTLTFDISSVGIQKITKAPSPFTANNAQEDNHDLTQINLSKYGKEGATITLRDLFKLYTDTSESADPFAKFTIVPDQTALSSLEDYDALFGNDLFGNDGMITLQGSNQDVTALYINKGFALNSPALRFKIVITDTKQEIPLSITILANEYVERTTNNLGADVYAQYPVGIGEGKIVKYDKDADEEDATLVSKIIALVSKITAVEIYDESIGTAVGTLDSDGNFIFNDFWDESTKDYRIKLDFGGGNKYTLSYTVEATVNRNIKIDDKKKTYNIIEHYNAPVSDYYEIVRQKGTAEFAEGVTRTISVASESYIALVDGRLRVQNTPMFDYNQTTRTQKFTFSVNDISLGERDLVYKTGLSYDTVASGIKLGGSSAKVESFTQQEVNYILTESKTWNLDGSIADDNTYSFDILPRYPNLGLDQRDYYTTNEIEDENGQRVKQITFNGDQAIRGLGDERSFLIVQVLQSNKAIAFMKVPLLISNIGMDFVSYSDSENNTLENALMSPNGLQTKGAYQEVNAGQIYSIAKLAASASSTKEFNFGFIYADNIKDSISLSVEPVGEYDNALFKRFITNENGFDISLNHMSKDIPNAYLGLKLTISKYNNFSLYFLLKVNGDTIVESPVYAYNGDKEYLTIDAVNENCRIDLNEKFGNETLHSGETRYNIKVGENSNPDLKYIYDYSVNIPSLAVGENPKDYIEVGFEGDIATFTMRQRVQDAEVTVTRVYSGGQGDEEFSVVGGEISYVFMINGGHDYTLNYSNYGTNEPVISGANATWTVASSGATQSEQSVTVKIKEGSTIGDGELSYHVYSNEKGVNIADLATITYENDKFSITRAGYLDKDHTIYVNFYTTEGAIGTLTINLPASATAVLKSEKERTIFAGTNLNITDFVSGFKMDGNEYTGTYTITEVSVSEEGKDIFSFGDDKLFKFFSSINDLSFTLTVTGKFGENQSFTFDIPVKVKANLTRTDKEPIVEGSPELIYIGDEDPTQAGNDRVIKVSKLYSGSDATNLIAKYSWVGNEYIVEGSNVEATDNRINITTNAVPSNTRVEVAITVSLYNSLAATSPYKTFTVNYSFLIVPNTKIIFNYPKVNNDDEEKKEYLSSGATFESAGSFFNSQALFATGNRLAFTDNAGKDIVEPTYTAKIQSLQNATIRYNGGTLTAEDGNNILYDGTINLENITFSIVDASMESNIDILIESNRVAKVYQIGLLARALSLDIKQANDSDGVETFYVENLTQGNGTQIFADNRLAEFTVGNINSTYLGNYVIAFTKSDGDKVETKTANIKLTENSREKTLYVDMNESLGGYEYFATYKDSYDEKNIIDNSLIYSSNPHLTSRLQMTYAGKSVDYDKFSDVLQTGSDNLSTMPLNMDTKKIDKPQEVKNFQLTLDNGQIDIDSENVQTNSVYTFSNVYTYKTSIDIDVGGKGAIHYHKIGVNQILSIISDMEIKNPSTGSLINAKGKNYTLDVVRVGIDDTNTATAADALGITVDDSNYFGWTQPYYLNTNHPYLRVSRKLDGTTETNDYNVLGLGANNLGNFVALKITYTVTVGDKSIHKDFYVMYKVVSDYKIEYDQTSNIDNQGTLPVNADIIKKYAQKPATAEGVAEGEPVYTLNVAGGTDATNPNFVTVKHTQGLYDDDPNLGKDVAARDFTYTLTLDTTRDKDNTQYNIAQNVKSKFGLFGTSDLPTGWTSEDRKVYTYASGTALAFTGVAKVIFAQQSYILEAVDSYGFKFQVRFALMSDGDTVPQAMESGTFEIIEGRPFDIGVVYEYLTVNKTGNTLNITSNKGNQIHGTDDYQVINLANIKAYGFDKEYGEMLKAATATPTDTNKYFTWIKDVDKNYTLKKTDPETTISNDAAQYLIRPEFADVKVNKIYFTRNGEKCDEVAFTTGNTDDPTKNTNNSLATYKKMQDEDTRTDLYFTGQDMFRNPKANYIMPTLDSDIYGTSSQVDVVMMIELQYQVGSIIETYTVPVNIKVTRNYRFVDGEKTIVRDGEMFTISEYISCTDATSKAAKVDYYDDTLIVALPYQGSVTFDVTLTRDGKEINKITETVDNSSGFADIQTRSLSQLLKTTIKPSDTIKVDVTNSGNGNIDGKYYGYYIEFAGKKAYKRSTSETNELGGNGVSPKDMEDNDTIRIVKSARFTNLANKLAQVTKYYVAYINVGGGKYYQVDKQYKVSPNVLSMDTGANNKVVTEYVVEKDFYTSGEGENQTTKDRYVIPVLGWMQDATLQYRAVEGGDLEPINITQDLLPHLKFEITQDAHASGAAKVDADGTVSTLESFRISEYIAVSIYVKASGIDGEFSETATSDHFLGTIYFTLKGGVEGTWNTQNQQHYKIVGVKENNLGIGVAIIEEIKYYTFKDLPFKGANPEKTEVPAA